MSERRVVGRPAETPVGEDAPVRQGNQRAGPTSFWAPMHPRAWVRSFLYAGGVACLGFSWWVFGDAFAHSVLSGHMNELIWDIFLGRRPDVALAARDGLLSGVVGLAAILRARTLVRPRTTAGTRSAAGRDDIAARCEELGAVPEELAGPLERALAAHAAIVEMAADPAWRHTRVPVRKHAEASRSQILALLNRARRLVRVGAALSQPASGEDPQSPLHELRQHYEAHCARLASAAAMFEQAQVSLARALLAVTDRSGTAVEAPLREMAGSFDALAEVLESLEQAPAMPASPTPAGPAGEGERREPSRLR